MTLLNQQFLLAQRPVGAPTRETFEFVEKPLGEPGPNQILVKVEYLSIDPAMRGWMNDAKSYIPPVGIGEVGAGEDAAPVLHLDIDALRLERLGRDDPETVKLTGIYHNLIRHWAEV